MYRLNFSHDKTQTQTQIQSQPQPNLTYPPKIGDRRNLLVGRCDENALHRLSVEETVAACHAKSHCKMKMKNTKTMITIGIVVYHICKDQVK